MEPQRENDDQIDANEMYARARGWPAVPPGTTREERIRIYLQSLASNSRGSRLPADWWDRLPADEQERILEHVRETNAWNASKRD